MALSITKDYFLSILEEAKKRLLSSPDNLRDIFTGDAFEETLYQTIKEICKSKGIPDEKCVHTGKHTFPDIIIRPFGIEAKFTEGDSWKSTGNSIMETTKEESLEEIFIFFCRKGKNTTPSILYKSYVECLSDISVTHSPRYKIDMELLPGNSVFDKMGTTYKEFNGPSRIAQLKKYFKDKIKPGDEVWWFDSSASEDIDFSIIKSLNNLDESKREMISSECMVVFPEILGNTHNKFLRIPPYLMKYHSVVTHNLRDMFTAGGKSIFKVKGIEVEVPQIFLNLRDRAPLINSILPRLETTLLSEHWAVDLSNSDRLLTWKALIDKHGVTSLTAKDSFPDPLRISDIFEEGLKVS